MKIVFFKSPQTHALRLCALCLFALFSGCAIIPQSQESPDSQKIQHLESSDIISSECRSIRIGEISGKCEKYL